MKYAYPILALAILALFIVLMWPKRKESSRLGQKEVTMEDLMKTMK